MNVEQKMAIRRQAVFWLGALIVFLLILWVLGDILLPFVAGMALAYFLDPIADRFERAGLGRLAATVIILFFFVILFVLAVVIFIPVVGGQVADLLERLPDYASRLQKLFSSLDYEWLNALRRNESTIVGDSAGQLVQQGASWIGTLLEKLWASGAALISLFSLLVVTPVVAFYLLYDWDRMVAAIDGWLPRDHRDEIHQILRDIDAAVAGFVRGQGTLCLVLGLFYGISLTVAGLNFGLVIGLFAGLISFIPYVGSLVGFLLSVGVALVQFWPELWPIFIVIGIFLFGQFMEGNILQPKLVGERVGLHPVWVMLALFAFGSLFGFTGMLVAVPVSAAIGVLVRYALARYLDSELYHGHDAAQSGTGPAPPGEADSADARPRRKTRK